MTRRLRIAILLSGLGHVVHNVEEFGLGAGFVGQTLLPAAVTAVLIVAVRWCHVMAPESATEAR